MSFHALWDSGVPSLIGFVVQIVLLVSLMTSVQSLHLGDALIVIQPALLVAEDLTLSVHHVPHLNLYILDNA